MRRGAAHTVHSGHGIRGVPANRFDSVQGRPAIEDRVGERHAATRDGRLLTVVNGDSVAGAEEPVYDGRADVAHPADQSAHHHGLASARFVAFGRGAGRPVIALVVFGRRAEHHEAGKERSSSNPGRRPTMRSRAGV